MTLLIGSRIIGYIMMGVKKVKVYTVIHEGASSKCIGTMKGEEGESLVDIRIQLEEKKVLPFEFQY